MTSKGLLLAAEHGKTVSVEKLLKHNVGVNVRSVQTLETPLIMAAKNGHWKVVELLLERGADIDLEDWNNNTALMQAIRNGHVEVVRILTERGANATTTNKGGKTAFTLAEEKGFDDGHLNELSHIAKLQDYKQGKRLGSGSYGTVYECKNSTGDSLAVKEIAPNQKTYIKLTEAEALQKLIQNAHIITYYGHIAGRNGSLMIYMELCECDLESYIDNVKKTGKWIFEDKLDISVQVADGLKFVHDNRIVHRDIKPGNILIRNIRGKTVAKLSDFGQCKILSDKDNSADVSMSMQGTREYMAPEVFLAAMEDNDDGGVMTKGPGYRVDIFSFGLVIVWLFWGRETELHDWNARNRDDFDAWPILETLRMTRVEKTHQNKLKANVREMIRKNPKSRPTANKVLYEISLLLEDCTIDDGIKTPLE